MSNLVKYDAACRAIAECKKVDEVKSWHDKAAAMQAYGRMANDKTLEIDAAEIRIRAERRLGELIVSQKATVGLNTGVRMAGKSGTSALVSDEGRKVPKLSDVGVSYDLSSRAQKIAAVPEAEFEAEVSEWRGRVQQEGARVTSRLESAGEREIKKSNLAAVEQIPEDEGPSEEELRAEELRDKFDREYLDKLLEADDKLKFCNDEIKRLNALLATVTSQRDGFMNGKAQLAALLKRANARIDKLEKQLGHVNAA